ncbi:response regulator transcription factor [Cohnella sp. AR92]|uniref:response regulator transcription factor n=1 Tax=Cohnella sp. AR92 TaxID=648716 RepID=UPI000F8F6080|nr:response regulator transcription factor [Cohnella sp. AR92]RUS46498.1 response regulator transcription factor [Cohnella sp. AR92]
MPNASVLVVDDESEITDLIALYLEREGFRVHTADNGPDAIRLADSVAPDLIILDINLGQPDGIEVCRSLRKGSGAYIPILFLSCKAEDNDIIHALSEGGDDYITKPFSPSTLVARVSAHIRRRRMRERLPEATDTVLIFGELEIDMQRFEVKRGGELIPLSVKEFELLTVLSRQPNRVFPLDELYRLVWHSDSMGDTRTLMVHISNLRKKIEPDPLNPSYIQTVRGFGYRFSACQDVRAEA